MRRLLFFCTTAILFAAPLLAQAGAAYCNPCCSPCSGRFEVGGELLWTRPSTCDLLYAVIDPRTFDEIVGDPVNLENLDNVFPVGKKHAIRPDHRLGFRVWAAFITQCCVDITGEYTRFHHHYKAHAEPRNNGGLWPTFMHPKNVPTVLYDPSQTVVLEGEVPAEAFAHTRFNYDAGEVQLGSRATFGCNCALWVRGFAAVHYYHLDTGFKARYLGTENPGQVVMNGPVLSRTYFIESRRSAKIWGVGPRIGLQAAYDVLCGLGIGGRLGVGVLAGGGCAKRYEQQEIFQNNIPPYLPELIFSEILDLTESERVHVVPRIDARLGVNYTGCFCNCLVLSVEVGYEFISYINPIRSELFTGTRATSRELCNSFNLEGLYVSVMGQF